MPFTAQLSSFYDDDFVKTKDCDGNTLLLLVLPVLVYIKSDFKDEIVRELHKSYKFTPNQDPTRMVNENTPVDPKTLIDILKQLRIMSVRIVQIGIKKSMNCQIIYENMYGMNVDKQNRFDFGLKI